MHIEIACTDTVDVTGAPEEIKILPIGNIVSQKGDFIVDDESVELIIKSYKSRRLDLVIDYEHQTIQDIQAPASGWIKDIYKGKDALIAKVEWTEKAKEYLVNKEYKYLSPVVLVRKSDNRAVTLHSVALTNTPAIDGMFPIVNSIKLQNEDVLKGEIMLEKLIEMLGLPEDTTEEALMDAIDTLKKGEEMKAKEKQEKEKGEEKKELEKEAVEVVANSTILGLLGLDNNAKTEDVVTEIVAMKNGGVMSELIALKEKLEEKEADDLVMTALKDGKISPAMKEWAKTYALKDADGFQKFVNAAPKVVPVGKLNYAEQENAKITEEDIDLKVLKDLGMTEDDIKKYVGGEK